MLADGGITVLIDGCGNGMVEYAYDAWEREHAMAGALTAAGGTLNPIWNVD